mmetsp:Transcript_561/g.989  ORF Transcript_561/g.989 Transcript_561/m.989 type:complete len:1946 (-) Transcript_561:923-6760(-)|eukprot:CAMPEP_0176496872 /NCGR_PEP_ID=MMETSP0200_2-20121128/11421_1 /TAXON_ID=947934 /ORGANISM="Chaetoceros sp., Strain GSL56" /LENGTH=1945 /DNA_ID=CAMNT_0017894845 /DNA_START=268 /DNA_END=6105 /DNA_ORIENTATION=-
MTSKVATGSGRVHSRRNSNNHIRDPPPPPPPNPPPIKRTVTDASTAAKSHGIQAQFDSWNDASVSSRESGSGTMSSRSSSHRRHDHLVKQPQDARGGRSVVAPPPPPPPGPPPSADSSTTTAAMKNFGKDPKSTSGSRSNRKKISTTNGNGTTISSARATMDHRDDRDRDLSLVGDDNDDDEDEEEEEESIETHILQYGHDGTRSVHSQSTRESAADRRRRRALEQQQQHERGVARASPNKSNSGSKNDERNGKGSRSFVASTNSSPRHRGSRTNNNSSGKDTSYYEDPPLELYSEDSEGESTDGNNTDNDDDLNHHSPHKAINAKNQEKKKSGFSRVKNFIRMGNHKSSTSSSPAMKGKVGDSPSKQGSSRRNIQGASNSPKKRGGFLQRLSISPGKRRSVTPDRKSRGREKDSDAKSKSNGKAGLSSPFRFRSRSRSASKTRKNEDDTVKRSAEIVVNKEKLKENEIRMQEIAEMDELIRGNAEKSKVPNNGSQNNAANRHEKDMDASAPVSTFERLRKDRDERRKRDLRASENGHFPILSHEDEDLDGDHNSRKSASAKSHASSSWVRNSKDEDDNTLEEQSSMLSSVKSQKSLSASHASAKLDTMKGREGYRQNSRDGSLQDSDVEIVSRSHSDDVSEVTDPTYMTRETREQKVKSPVNNLDTVHEISSPEHSPRSKSEFSKRERHQNYADDLSDDRSPYMRNVNDHKSKSFESSQSSKGKRHEKKSPGEADDSGAHKKQLNDNEDSWNPENFTGKENFVSTIDPFVKAKPSTDPFDRPFYLADSKDDEPKQMFSFVYSESDAELERGAMSKDTMTGISFDSEDDEINNMDGLSYATPSSKSDLTEIMKNSASNRTKTRKQMLPPSSTFVPKMYGAVEERPRGNGNHDGFLGIDERSGAVTLNGETSIGNKLTQYTTQPSKMRTGRLSQRALDRPKKINSTSRSDEELGHQRMSVRTSPNSRRGSDSRSPERLIHQASSFTSKRREKRKAREQEIQKKEEKIVHPNPYIIQRGKNDVTVAIERGRRREWLFESEKKSMPSQCIRTYSPDKLKFALTNEGDSVNTRTLAQSTPRSPRLTPSRRVKTFNRQESWFEKPQYDTRQYRAALASLSASSSRSAFKAPPVFGKNPLDGPFKAPEPYRRRTDPVLASVAHIQDPIQRAGAVILSAAAIPIQAEMRRYLAVKHREDRAWAIIVVQAYFRRWKAELTRYKYLYCATRIQAAFRGWLLRDTMEDKHYCATQIQKIARGYLATLRVYEDLYNITVVQSIARRHAAIKNAKRQLQAIQTIQAFYRGWLGRRQVRHLHHSATKIQSAWRGYYMQLNYQFDVVDIIIVQSIARRRAAMAKAKYMREKKIFDAATTIQKYWRSYDCTMNYLHTVADVLVVQSIVRRWIAIRYVSDYREKLYFTMAMRIQMLMRSWMARTKVKKQRAAREIQKVWRGFWTYTDYVFTLADIIVVQKTVRAHLARKKVAVMAKARQERNEYAAAVMIQKNWRAYSAQMEMLFNLVHIIIAQSIIRRRIAIIKFKPRLLEYRAATKIQRGWRVFMRKRDFMENYCATIIQSKVRCRQAIQLRHKMITARTIQAWYRCQATRRGYLYYMSARKIQTIWRGYDARKLADEERWVREYAATTIQKTWRMFYQYSSFVIYKHEKKAATDIQRHWRGFWKYSHYVIMRYEVCKIQALVRGVQHRKRLAQQNEAATVIQTAARSLIAKKACHMERLFRAMIYAAQQGLSQKIAARTIQRGFREHNLRAKQKHAALVIERFFIWVRAEVEREIERRERQRIKKRRGRSRSKNDAPNNNNDMLDDAYNTVSKSKRSESSLQSKFKKSLNANTSRSRPNSEQRPSQPLSVDLHDNASAVSGLTNPIDVGMKFKVKNKGYHDQIDDELEGAWKETMKMRGRPKTSESQKENSSTYTPSFKVSARSLSRNREELRRARVP